MPVIVCPKCKGKLRMPDNAGPRRVKCPNCAFIFMSTQAAVEGNSAPKTPPGRPKSAAQAAQAAMRDRDEPDDDFEVVDEDDRPRAKRRVRDDDEDDDDRPRSKRRRVEDEDDEDDRPRRRRRDEDEDEEDEDDRPRARRRRDEDDDDDDRPRRRRRADDEDDEDPREARRREKEEFGRGEIGAFLNSIALWIAMGGVGVTGLGFLSMPFVNFELAGTTTLIGGIAGLAATITSLVGYGFSIAGPKKKGALGLSIATVAVAGLRLLLLLLLITDVLGTTHKFQRADIGGGGPNWSGGFLAAFNSLLPFTLGLGFVLGAGIPAMIPIPFGVTMAVIAMIFEFVQCLLYFLYLKSAAEAARNRSAAGSAKLLVILVSSIVGGLLILGLLVGVIVRSTADTGAGGGGGRFLFALAVLVSWGGVAAIFGVGAFTSMNVRDSLRRPR